MEKRLKVIWLAVLGVVLITAAVKLFLPVKSPVKIEETEAGREVVVYISGAVQKPGLFRLPTDSRLDDLLRLAVLSEDADENALNPAQRLKDGQKIIIPYLAGTAPGTPEGTSFTGRGGTGETAGAARGGTSSGSPEQPASSAGKININTANLSELDQLPGIGPVLAQRIIDYREQNGLFSGPEELQNVSGIGAKTYEKMAPYLTVGP